MDGDIGPLIEALRLADVEEQLGVTRDALSAARDAHDRRRAARRAGATRSRRAFGIAEPLREAREMSPRCYDVPRFWPLLNARRA